MTIFRLYVENGDRAGFWVQHRSWRNICARVLSVGGHQVGRLPGSPPHYGLPDVRVRWYDVRSGRAVPPPPSAALDRPEHRETEIDYYAAPSPPPPIPQPTCSALRDGKEHLLAAPDVHYDRIAEPAWSRAAEDSRAAW